MNELKINLNISPDKTVQMAEIAAIKGKLKKWHYMGSKISVSEIKKEMNSHQISGCLCYETTIKIAYTSSEEEKSRLLADGFDIFCLLDWNPSLMDCAIPLLRALEKE
jgi:hypothetical protein